VIVHDLHIVRIIVSPNKTYPPLVVDPDAMLSVTVPFQYFQPVAWGYPQVLQGPGAMEIEQLPARASLEGSEPRHVYVGEQGFGVLASKSANH
jgi:hypothetical protein